MEAKRYHFEHLIQTLATFGNEQARESISLSSMLLSSPRRACCCRNGVNLLSNSLDADGATCVEGLQTLIGFSMQAVKLVGVCFCGNGERRHVSANRYNCIGGEAVRFLFAL